MCDLEVLKNLVLASFILKATALISVKCRVGGNQFRHCFSTLGILPYLKFYHDSMLLKAALLQDLLEDLPETPVDEIRDIDHESHQVVDLVPEVTKTKGEPKPVYPERVLNTGSRNALLLKCAGRISNLNDLHPDTHKDQEISEYPDQTEQYVLPVARRFNAYRVIELTDPIKERRKICKLIDRNKTR